MRDELEVLSGKFGVNVCGEGGEYETFTLDCPLFRHKLVITESNVVTHSDDGCVSVELLRILKLEIQRREDTTNLSHLDLLRYLSKLQNYVVNC